MYGDGCAISLPAHREGEVPVGLMLAAAGLRQLPAVELAGALAGTCAGFLLFNFHPARIFMGDSGAHFLGTTLAVVAILGVAIAENLCEGVRVLLSTPVDLIVVDAAEVRLTAREMATLFDRVAPRVSVVVAMRSPAALDQRERFPDQPVVMCGDADIRAQLEQSLRGGAARAALTMVALRQQLLAVKR